MLDDIEIKDGMQEGVSFFKTNALACPACEHELSTEEMRTGSGRLDAGELQHDLQRKLIPSERFGAVYPTLYLVYTCPKCYFSALKFDFERLSSKSIANITTPDASTKRTKELLTLFENIPNFSRPKTLITGLASYILALSTYNQMVHTDCPTIRMAICSMRCAWLCQDIIDAGYTTEMGQLKKIFLRKAFFLYDKALDLNLQGKEDVTKIPNLGPDFDTDFGYDGVIYLHAWLYVNHSPFIDVFDRSENLSKIRTNLSKVFGFGKSSKEKPSALLDFARITYEQVEQEMQVLM